MNLILSDVEETIMIVDAPEGAPPGQGLVNVSDGAGAHRTCSINETLLDSQTKNGYAFCPWRRCYFGTLTLLIIVPSRIDSFYRFLRHRGRE